MDITIILLVVCLWYIIGVSIFLYTCWRIIPVITLSDLIVALVSGFLGPVNLIWFFVYSDFGDFVIFRRKNNGQDR